MSQTTEFRIRMRLSKPDEGAVDRIEAIRVMMLELPISPIQRCDMTRYGCPAEIRKGESFAHLMPNETIEGEPWRMDGSEAWRIEDGEFIAAFSLLNPRRTHDRSNRSQTPPNRETRLMRVLSAACDLEEGRIVGGFLQDAQAWQPLVVTDGMIRRAYVEDRWLQRDGTIPSQAAPVITQATITIAADGDAVMRYGTGR